MTMVLDWVLLPLLLSGGISTFVAGLALAASRRRSVPGATAFGVMMLGVAVWAFAYAVQLEGAGLPTQMLGARLKYIGTSTVPLAWLAFALRYGGWGRRSVDRLVALLGPIAAATVVLTWTNEAHRLVWADVTLQTHGARALVAVTHGPWFWVHTVVAYAALAAGTVVATRTFVNAPGRFGARPGIALVAMGAPWLANLLYLTGLGPTRGLDLTPFAFTVTGVAILWGFFRLRLLDVFLGLVPVARDAALTQMRDGVLILDPGARVLDANPAAERFLGRPRATLVGRGVDELAEALAPLAGAAAAPEVHARVTLDTGAEPRDLDVLVSPLQPHPDDPAGRLVVMRDLTEPTRMLQESQALLAVAQSLTGSLDRVEVMRRICREAARLVGADTGLFFDIDASDARRALQAAAGYRVPPALVEVGSRLAVDTLPADLVAALDLRQSYFVRDIAGDPRTRGGVLETLGVRSLFASPVHASGHTFGTVALVWWHRTGDVSPRDAELLAGLASQGALALENASLHATALRRAQELATLNRFALLIESALDERELFKLIALESAGACGAERCSIFIWDDERHQVVPVMSQFASGTVDETMWVAFKAQKGLRDSDIPPALLEAVLTGAPVVIADTATDLRVPRLWADTFRSRSALVVPLRQGDTPFGAVVLDHVTRAIGFTPEQVQLAMALTGHVAVALGKAKLYTRMQAQLRQTETLLAVGQVLAGTLDGVEIARRTLRETVRCLGADCGGFWMLASTLGRFLPVAAYHAPREIVDAFLTTTIAPDDALVQALRQGPIHATHSERDPRLGHEVFRILSTRSLLVQPISAGGTLIGAMVVAWLRERHRFSGQDLRLAEAIASQAAVAIELRQAQEQIVQQERLRALGQMASGIAHDFNNALVPILGFADIVVEDLDAPGPLDRAGLRRRLESIRTSAADAASVVSRLREFYRPRDLAEMNQSVDLARLATEVRALTQPRWKDQALASGTAIEFALDCTPVPPIAGNERQLREALTNLVFNAVDAIRASGTIAIRTRLEHGTTGPRVTLAVSDTGIGMTAETQRRCLEPFFSTKGEHGSGMGLATVFGTVRRHGGTLEVQSEPGKGTTLVLQFPLQSSAPPAAVAAGTAPSGRHLRALVVDDEPASRALLVEYLQRDGHTVEVAANGREGLAQYLAGRFDVVITDWAMPGLTGDQLVAMLGQVGRPVPVVMLTGFGDSIRADGVLPTGVDVVLTKPVSLADFRRGLAQAVALHPREP